jgi:fermentation-respiration switch protein FrsA (DUF1100 family)
VRDLVRRDVERARDVGAALNHDLLADGAFPSLRPLSSLDVPTLVIHGTADPLFPTRHGEALASEIPGARLHLLEGAGHGVERADWTSITGAILEHTAAVDRGERTEDREATAAVTDGADGGPARRTLGSHALCRDPLELPRLLRRA